jgi:hypothetical protein
MDKQEIDSKRVALASFPRSGNTWLRFMIEQATGQKSGSAHRDLLMPRGSEGIVIKTHRLDSDRYTRAIHLIRSPFDAIASHFYHKRDFKCKDIEWEKHVEESVERWRLHSEHWLAAQIPILRIKYEDLRVDTKKELARVLSWLGFAIPEDDIADTVNKARLESMRKIPSDIKGKFLRDEEHVGRLEHFFRRGQSGVGVNRFSAAERQFAFNSLRDLLKKLGYDDVVTTPERQSQES